MKFMKDYFQGIWKDRYVLGSLVRLDLQLKYNRSVLGVAWSLITPLGLALIIGLVYAILFSTNPAELIPLLFAGLNPWNFLSGSLDGGALSYMGAEGYIKQTTVSTHIFPLRTVLVNFVNLLYSVVAFLALYLFLAPDKFGPCMLMILPGLLVEFVGVLALSNLSAVINLYVRDFRPLQSLFLQGLFYVTPIIYTTDQLDSKGFSFVYQLNPLYYLIEIVKQPMMGNVIETSTYLIATIMSIGLFIISVYLVMRISKKVAFKL